MRAMLVRVDDLNEPHAPAGFDRCRCDSLDCPQRASRRLVWKDPACSWESSSLHCAGHAYEIATAAGAGSLVVAFNSERGSRV